MQTLAKSSRQFAYPKSLFTPSIKHLLEEQNFNNEHIFKLWNNFHACRFFHVSKQACRLFKKEYQAGYSLLRQSQQSVVNKTYLQNLITLSRNFSGVCVRFQNASNPGNQPPNPSSKDNSGDGNKQNSDKGPSEKEKLVFLIKCIIFMSTTVFISSTFLANARTDNQALNMRVSWHDFVYHMLLKGEVEQITVQPESEVAVIILHRNAIIKGQPTPIRHYILNISNVESFESKIRAIEKSLGIRPENAVTIAYDRSTATMALFVSLMMTLFFGLLLFSIFKNPKWNNSKKWLDSMRSAKFTLVDPLTGSGRGVRFADVAGLKEAKIEIMELVDYLKRPEYYKALGAKVPKGALLLGPPGCGKTMLAKAVATEANVPFLSMNGTEFVEMVGGLGAARVRSLFEEGKKRAPSIIYIDEIDSIGGKRLEGAGASFGNRESEQTLNQLLVEMDGMASRGDVIVISSTNRPEVLDTALLRPGRFDRHITIDLPTLTERREIFEQHLKCIKLDKEPKFYSLDLASVTPGFSGADIANVCNEAALHAARHQKTKVDFDDLSHAIDRVLAGAELKNHSMPRSEKKIVAYREAGHAVTAWVLEHSDALLKISIVPRSKSFGFTKLFWGDQYLYSKEKLLDKMCVMLGSRIAESIIFNKITTLNADDSKEITKIAYSLVREYGMSNTVGLVSFPPESTDEVYRKPYSKFFGNLMDAEASRIVAECSKRTEKVLLENKEKLILVAEELLKRETLTYDDVEKLIGPPPFGKKKVVDPAAVPLVS